MKSGILGLAPGFHTLDYRCPGVRTFRSRKLDVPEQSSQPIVFRVDKQDCRQKTRR